MKKLINWLKRLITKCDRCECCGAETYRQNTRYTKEESNWTTLCPDCKEENDAHWEYMQDEYSGQL